ncbi:MAG: alginate export family protein [Gammaproteobacteria bacterium]|nr:alginate export family protein [Gammaproteobacteria bacterium]
MLSSRTYLSLCLVSTSLWANHVAAQNAGDASSIAQAFRDGAFDLALRYRYEHVDQDGFSAHANASVLRTRLTFETARLNGFSLTLEADDMRAVGADSFNSTRNGKTQLPIVADPAATDLNQLLISHVSASGLIVSLGRQRLVSSSRRFVGSINWRQNEQTFDSISVGRTFGADTEASYAYVNNVNRIFGPKDGNPPAELGGEIHVMDVRRTLASGVRFWGYGYFLDFDTAAALSSATLGLRVEGQYSVGDELRVPFALDFARQRDHADNPFDYAVSYWRIQSGIAWKDFTALAGVEVLDGTGRTGEAFSTPLAGLHALNGWADKFISTPAGGLEDRHVQFGLTLGGADLNVIYHEYAASADGSSYGTELDVSVAWSIAERYSVLIKTADYRAEGFSTDVRKFWIMIGAAF